MSPMPPTGARDDPLPDPDSNPLLTSHFASPTPTSSPPSLKPTMSFLQFLRAVLLLVAITTALSTSSVAASDEGNSAANSTADDGNSTSRHLMAAATDYHAVMLNAINAERLARGLPRLCRSRKLQSAAQTHSNDMARRNYLGHTGSDGSTIESRIDDAGYNWVNVSENVAAGQASVRSVMASWMSSRYHRANILSRNYRMFGCGYAYRSSTRYGHYWTQDFAAGSGEVCS